MHDTEKIETVLRYHERTKHHFDRYAPGPGELDGANQPDPFCRYEGAPLVRLPLLGPDDPPASPHYNDLYRPRSVPSVPLTIRSLSRLLQYGLALSAWKQAGATRWTLRCNPSSGNLHPTEGYVLIGALPGFGEAAGLYHYAPREHALERRADCSTLVYEALMLEFPAQAFLVGLSSIHWREACTGSVRSAIASMTQDTPSARCASPPRPWAGRRCCCMNWPTRRSKTCSA